MSVAKTPGMSAMSSTPRVLMISDVYFPRVNGVSTSIQTFRRDLDALGCQTTLVAPDYPSSIDSELQIERIPSRYLPLDPEDRIMHYRKLQQRCKAIADQFDVIHIHTPFLAHYAGGWLSKKTGLPVVETYHTYFEHYLHHYLPFLPHKLTSKVARTLSRKQCNSVDSIIAPTDEMAAALIEYQIKTPITVIPTGIDCNQFSRGNGSEFRKSYGIPHDRPVMLNVGRVAFEKNLPFLIKVLKEVKQTIPDVLLLIAGEGPAQNSLQQKVKKSGLTNNVLFVGYLERGQALLDCYQSADVFVFASRTETQGLVLLEAMALGVPVVSTAVMGTASVLKDATGAIVVPEDVRAFTDGIIPILTNPIRKQQLSEAAQVFVQHNWSSSEMARRVLSHYQQLINQKLAEPENSHTSATIGIAQH